MSLNTILATTPLVSTGYHLKATGTTIGNSLIWDNGTNVGIGNTNTSYTLDVSGTFRTTSDVVLGGGSTIFGTTGSKFYIYPAFSTNLNLLQNYNGSAYTTEEHRASDYSYKIGTTAAMTINSYGNVGINCDSSNKKLYCQSNNATSSYFAFGAQNGVENIFLIRGDGLINTGLAAYSPYNFSVTPGRPVYVNTSGELGYYTSTRESKININPINNFGIINKLNPVSFNYRIKDENNQYTDEFDKNIFYGLIADEVEKIDSNLVFYDKKEDGTKELKGVYYEQLAPLLIKAIQEMNTKIIELEKIVATK